MVPTKRAFLGSAILVLAIVVRATSGDMLVPGRHPNLLERIVEPIVREVQLSQMVGPEKRPFWDAGDPLLNKLKLQPVLAPVAAQGVSAPDSDHSGLHKPEGEKGPASTGNQPSLKEELKVAIGPRARRAPRSPGEAPSLVGRDNKGQDLMHFFWNNFIAAPPVVNPDFVPRPPVAVAGFPGAVHLKEKANETVATRTNGSDVANATDIKPVARLISVDFEVFVFPNPAAVAAKKNGSEQVGGFGGMLFPGGGRPFFQLPTNRSAYSAVDAFPAQYVAVDAAAAPTSPPAEDRPIAGPSSSGKGFTKISLLLMLLVVACSISCVLGSALPFVMQKKRVPSVWVTKTGKKIVRPQGAPANASSVPSVRLVTDFVPRA